MSRFKHSFFVAMACTIIMMGAKAAEPAPPADQSVVGEISLVLGKAFIVNADNERVAARRGLQLQASDQVFTEANGHVHIHFADDALVSVRPGSRLEIVRYDYDPARPEQSSVKFNLEEGVTRAISGDAAKSARDRFRLNTPIAAIGVRGTDFIVSATDRTTRALVREGAIVMAPYSSECAMDAFGPCDLNAVELTDASLQIFELESESPTPRLMPAPHERDPNSMRGEVQLALADSDSNENEDDKTVSNDVYLESVTTTRVTAEAAGLDQGQAGTVDPLPGITPENPVTASILNERQLVWGRWSNGYGDAERITLSYNSEQFDRKITVATDDLEYRLYRPELNGTRVAQDLGVISFGLTSAQAFYDSANGVVAMQVDGGNLDIDFVASTFNTGLDLSHDITGAVNFNASGNISDGGYFNSRLAEQTMAGAVSIDGQEAGYFFEKQLQDGSVSGLTLWDSQ
ncbi:MAG: FecR domain-containing protein [Gammaproteobacteria bacterium]